MLGLRTIERTTIHQGPGLISILKSEIRRQKTEKRILPEAGCLPGGGGD